MDNFGRVELLAPAGDLERLRMAVLYGADAVYLAGTDFGMRAFAGNFSPEGLAEAVAFAHAHGVRVHCTVNTMPRNEEMDRLPAHLEVLESAGVDAVILADLGAFALDFALLRRGRLSARWAQLLGLAVLWGLAFCFVWCTFRPPQIALWQDPVTGQYGTVLAR